MKMILHLLLLVLFHIITSGILSNSIDQCSAVLPHRFHVVSLADYGALGDGVTLNTQAFQNAISDLQRMAVQDIRRGMQLNVPAGQWLTGSFNLTSHFTLFLQKGAVILGSQSIQDWPIIDPLPSYGRGRERPGGRYISLIHGQDLVDVVITGENGTIDGQGDVWWKMWYNRTLEHTRGHLVEFVSSEKIVITNTVLKNSPFWTIHPVYCKNVVIKGVYIFAPSSSPNTDGIDPDSSTNVCIEDCHISNGDDMISIKSGWDEYGIAVGRPSSGILIRRVSGTTPFSGVSIGSEMSGGVKDVYIKDVHIFNTGTGIRIKSAPGRGGYVMNITISGMRMQNVKRAIDVTTDAAEHPDDLYNVNSLPVVKGLVIENIVGEQVDSPGRFMALIRSPLAYICMSNIALNLTAPSAWLCANVQGTAISVSPTACLGFQHLGTELCGDAGHLS